MTLVDREKQLKEVYKREDKSIKTQHKLKQQVDVLVKEQTKLVLRIKDMQCETDFQVKERNAMESQLSTFIEREKQLEFKVNSMQE